MNRMLIVGRLVPGTEDEIAEIFAESDQTDLYAVTGARHRSLYCLGDLFLHLLETEESDPARIERARSHPEFVRVNERLATRVSPYSPTWRSPRDAVARRFYQWDSPASGARNPAPAARLR